MGDKNRLQNMILIHWQTHCPVMVQELTTKNLFTTAVQEAESIAMDSLHHMLFIRKMQYQEAWELAMQECLLSPTSSPSGHPATSASQTTSKLVRGAFTRKLLR